MNQLRGQELKQAFSAATDCLEEYRDAVNALNVFPVPDGDTGTNMLLTMRAAVKSAVEGCPDGQDHSADSVCAALAQGAFFGARGNSGVILSQFFRGFSDALNGEEFLTARDLALAFKLASAGAYKSVGNPVEGTMLTVIRMASEAVQGPDADVLSLWETAYHASREALERTPQLLPVLSEAGVVDAGGLGIVILIGGALRSISGPDSSILIDLSQLSRLQGEGNPSANPIRPGFLDTTLEQEWGYCTEFIISSVNGQVLDLEQVRGHYLQTALSTVVVGDEHNMRVHIHVENTAQALGYAESCGVVSEIKIENMDTQNQQFALGDHRLRVTGPALALLSVVQGEGLAHLFRDSGCAGVIEGGQTMNPSVQQILDAARDTGAGDVIFLPNNSNVVLAARQAATAEPSIHVVPTTSLPQGVAALLAFNPEIPLRENVDAMTAVLSEVATVEVTPAVRDVEMNGIAITVGQYIGLLNGQLVTAQDTSEWALRYTLELAGLSSNAIVTIYYGADRSASDVGQLSAELEGEFPGIQVDLIEGGQIHHQYLASVE